MNEEKWFSLGSEAFILRQIFDIMPDDFPNVRELRIQNAKLERMLTSPLHKGDRFGVMRRMLAGGSLKRYRKRTGRSDARIDAQAKKVRQLSERAFKTWLRQQKPRYTNAQFQVWKEQLYSGMRRSAERYKKEFKDKVARRLAQLEG